MYALEGRRSRRHRSPTFRLFISPIFTSSRNTERKTAAARICSLVRFLPAASTIKAVHFPLIHPFFKTEHAILSSAFLFKLVALFIISLATSRLGPWAHIKIGDLGRGHITKSGHTRPVENLKVHTHTHTPYTTLIPSRAPRATAHSCEIKTIQYWCACVAGVGPG